MTRLRFVVLVVALALVGGLAANAPAPTPVDRHARVLGPTDPARRIPVSLVLRWGHPSALHRFLAAIERSDSEANGRAMKPRRFGARFGLPDRRVAHLRAALAAHGLHVRQLYPQRTALRVRGSAAAVERVFATRLEERVDRQGRRGRVPVRPPRIPPWLGQDVVAVTGLDTRAQLRPAAKSTTDVGHGFSPNDLARIYDMAPLRDQGILGQGETVGVVSLYSHDPSDVARYESEVGASGPPVQTIQLGGGAVPASSRQLAMNNEMEVDLDLDVIRGLAPGAQVLNYEAPNGPFDPADVINRIVEDNRARIISDSWGMCELAYHRGEITAEQHALEGAVGSGITVFAASGDDGAYDCRLKDPSAPPILSVDWPAASPSVIGVGGTTLTVSEGPQYLSEAGWEDSVQGVGGGGGLSQRWAIPAYQQGLGVHNHDSNGNRQVPDVAGPSDPSSGVFIIQGGKIRGPIGGTSAAAPFWAASLALIRQDAAQHGVRFPTFLAPLLYRIAQPGSDAFHDVVVGGNLHYRATPGWDYSTGLGSPDVAALDAAIIREQGG